MPQEGLPRRDRYDVVVIGSGIGGITAAALLAKAGQSVLVVERQDGPGGYAHSFQRGPYTFDPAVRWVGDAGVFDHILTHLGVRDRCNLLILESFYTAVFPDYRLDLPRGAEAYIEAHVREFPHEEKGFREFMEVCRIVHHEAHMLPPTLSLKMLDDTAARFPTLFKYIRSTLKEVMDEYLTDPRLKALCAAPWPYVGLAPYRLAFMTFAQFLFSHVDAVFYTEGSFQKLVDALAAAVELNGGEVVLRNHVSRILVEDGKAVGIALQDGEQIRAGTVISNADAFLTFNQLVGPDHLPASFLRNLNRLTHSLSAFNVYAATKLDIPKVAGRTAHEFFYYKSWDVDEVYEQILKGQPWGMFLTTPTCVDPTLAPPGEHLIIASAMMPYDIGRPWEDEKDRYTEMLMDEIEQVLPGTRANLTFLEGATPLALERYTLNHKGSYVGWDMTPEQSTSRRPHHQTPVPGLYLSGHWTYPGGSVIRTFVSGMQTAAMVLMDLGQHEAAIAFQPPDMPPVH